MEGGEEEDLFLCRGIATLLVDSPVKMFLFFRSDTIKYRAGSFRLFDGNVIKPARTPNGR